MPFWKCDFKKLGKINCNQSESSCFKWPSRQTQNVSLSKTHPFFKLLMYVFFFQWSSGWSSDITGLFFCCLVVAVDFLTASTNKWKSIDNWGPPWENIFYPKISVLGISLVLLDYYSHCCITLVWYWCIYTTHVLYVTHVCGMYSL